SDWDRDCGFTTAAEAYATRLEEDRRACADLGADQVVLSNPDSPYRSDVPLAGLRELLESLDAGTQVLLPLGTNQPDHTRVRAATLEVLDQLGGVPPWVYAALPYAAALVHDWLSAPAAELMSALGRHDDRYRSLRAHRELTLLHSAPTTEAAWSQK